LATNFIYVEKETDKIYCDKEVTITYNTNYQACKIYNISH